MVDPHQLINVAVIVLMGYIAIIILANVQAVSSCDVVSGGTTNVYDHIGDNPDEFFTVESVNSRVGIEILSGNAIGKDIQKVQMKLAKSGLPTGFANVTIRDDNDNVLATDTIDVSTLPQNPSLPETFSFDFGSPITLQAGYRILFEFPDGIPAVAYVDFEVNDNAIPSGFSFSNYDGSYTEFPEFTPLMTFDYDPQGGSGGMSLQLSNACHAFFNNAGVLFTLAAVLLLLLVIPMIRSVVGGKQ